MTNAKESTAEHGKAWRGARMIRTPIEGTVKFVRCDSYSIGYEVYVDGALVGVVDRWDGVDGANWAATCREAGAGCSCIGFHRTRKEAAAALAEHPGQQGRIPDDLWARKEMP